MIKKNKVNWIYILNRYRMQITYDTGGDQPSVTLMWLYADDATQCFRYVHPNKNIIDVSVTLVEAECRKGSSPVELIQRIG